MKNEKKSPPKKQTIEKWSAVLGVIAAIGLLVLYLFFTKEQTGRSGSLFPLFIIFAVCAILAAILPLLFHLRKKDKN